MIYLLYTYIFYWQYIKLFSEITCITIYMNDIIVVVPLLNTYSYFSIK